MKFYFDMFNIYNGDLFCFVYFFPDHALSQVYIYHFLHVYVSDVMLYFLRGYSTFDCTAPRRRFFSGGGIVGNPIDIRTPRDAMTAQASSHSAVYIIVSGPAEEIAIVSAAWLRRLLQPAATQ